MTDKNFNIAISPSDWFDVVLTDKKLEIFSKDPKNTCILIFDFTNGELSILHKHEDEVSVNCPSLHVTENPRQMFFRFMSVLRNRNTG